MIHKIHYISHGDSPEEQLYHIESTLDAGQKWVQFRFKSADRSMRWSTAERVKKLCDTYRATLIVNDDPYLVQAIDADGVHLGLTDMPIPQARQILPTQIIGGTANTWDDIQQRHAHGCDYIGLGPYRFTTTKKNLNPILGLEGYRTLLQKMRDNDIFTPIIAIGGLLLEDVSPLKRTGIHGFAVSGLLQHATDKKMLIQQLENRLS